MNRRQFLQGASATFLATLLARRSPFAEAQTKPSEILKRKIPATGEMVPAVGLGTWQAFMPKDPHDATALASLEEVLKTFYDLGGRVVDTAPAYGTSGSIVPRNMITEMGRDGAHGIVPFPIDTGAVAAKTSAARQASRCDIAPPLDRPVA